MVFGEKCDFHVYVALDFIFRESVVTRLRYRAEWMPHEDAAEDDVVIRREEAVIPCTKEGKENRTSRAGSRGKTNDVAES